LLAPAFVENPVIKMINFQVPTGSPLQRRAGSFTGYDVVFFVLAKADCVFIVPSHRGVGPYDKMRKKVSFEVRPHLCYSFISQKNGHKERRPK